MSKSKFLPVFASAALLASSVAAQAALITLTASGSGSDGPLAASAQFTTSAGHIEVVLTNTLAPSQIISAGQALSDISFTLSNAPGIQGALTALGQQGNIAGTTPGIVTFVAGTPERFIGMGPPPPGGTGNFEVTGNTILMEAIGGGQPSQMILPAVVNGGQYANLNASLLNFNPSTIGPATFELDFAGVTAATTVTVATFSFGTGPDTFLTIPAPLIGHGLLALLAIGGGLLGSKLLEHFKKRYLQAA
jgi:hypothetical protein